MLVRTNAELRAALRTGSTRLVYYYGEASPDGLLLEGAERSFTWSELAALLQQSRSVSAVFLNLLGETSYDVIPQGRVLLNGAMAVLLQCNDRMAASAAAKAGLDWLHSVSAASERLDPVVALHQHQHGQVTAWTRYVSWQTVAPVRIEMPGLVNLLLDRRSQRAELSTAKDEFREESFHLGELEPLSGVRRQDLSNYFQDHQLCSCDDCYRSEFPPLLLGGRREMPFDEAVSAIRRGEPDNWGNLFEELQALTASGGWPPVSYTPNFWEARDGR